MTGIAVKLNILQASEMHVLQLYRCWQIQCLLMAPNLVLT